MSVRGDGKIAMVSHLVDQRLRNIIGGYMLQVEYQEYLRFIGKQFAGISIADMDVVRDQTLKTIFASILDKHPFDIKDLFVFTPTL